MSELIKALVRARVACPSVISKDGRNQAQNYKYVGHEQVLASGARAALLAHGLVLVEKRVTFLGELRYTTRNGEQTCWRWLGVFELVHESGEAREYEYEATTGPNDKSAFVASTALDRTAHLRVCCIAGSNEENPEHDSHDDFAAAARKAKRVERTLDDVAAGVTSSVSAARAAESRPLAASLNAIADKLEPAQTDARGATSAETGYDLDTGETDPEPPWPTSTCPVVQTGVDAGKSYTELTAPKCEAMLANAKFQREASTVQLEWARFRVTRRAWEKRQLARENAIDAAERAAIESGS